MIRNVLLLFFLCASLLDASVTHSQLTGTNVHTAYRWLFADSAARVNQAVVASDTMNMAFQRSDSTSWILVSTTGAKWKKVAFASNQNTLTTSNVQFNNVKSVRDSVSDIVVSDSVIAVTGAFSGALTGTTLNTGNGANELYAMNQNVRTTDGVTFDTIKSTKGINATGGTFSNRVTARTFQSTDTVRTATVYATSNVRTLGNVQGLYLISDNSVNGVDGVFSGALTSPRVIADSLKLGTGSYLKTYLDTTFYDSLYEGSTYLNQRVLARVIQVGNVITLHQPSCYSATSGGLITLRGLPSKFKPATNITVSAIVRSSSNVIVGQYSVGGSNSYIYLAKNDGNNLDTGTSGANITCVTWTLN